MIRNFLAAVAMSHVLFFSAGVGEVKAQATSPAVQTTALIHLLDLRCEMLAGWPHSSLEDRTRTVLGGVRFNALSLRIQDPIIALELEHSQLQMPGCDMNALDSLFEAAVQSFMHVEVPLTIDRSYSRPFISTIGGPHHGSCVQILYEKITVDLGNGIILQSSEGEYIPSDLCS